MSFFANDNTTFITKYAYDFNINIFSSFFSVFYEFCVCTINLEQFFSALFNLSKILQILRLIA